MSRASDSPITVTCNQCQNQWQTRAKIGSNVHCPKCGKGNNITKAHRPVISANHAKWKITPAQPQYSPFNCPECNAAAIWTIGHTSLECPQCGNGFVSPTAIERGMYNQRSREVQIKVDPHEVILSKAVMHSQIQSAIRYCQDILSELNTDEYRKLFPNLARPVGFSMEQQAIQYRDVFNNFINQLQAAKTPDELNIIMDVITKTRKLPEVDSVIANIRVELPPLARRISSITGNSWIVSDRKIVRANWHPDNENNSTKTTDIPPFLINRLRTLPKIVTGYSPESDLD